MADIAELGFKIDSSGLKDLNAELKKTPAAAAEAESWVTKLAEATKKVPQSAAQAVAANDDLADSTDGVTEAVINSVRNLGQYSDATVEAAKASKEFKNSIAETHAAITRYQQAQEETRAGALALA